MSQVGRISGPLLQSNLERNGIDLEIKNTANAGTRDVTGKRIGIGTYLTKRLTKTVAQILWYFILVVVV